MNFETISMICESSVVLPFWNFSLAGVLKKRSSTVTVVPAGEPELSTDFVLPAVQRQLLSRSEPPSLVMSSNFETGIDARRASPRKPSVLIEKRSSALFNLAGGVPFDCKLCVFRCPFRCRHPRPLSIFLPPSLTSTDILLPRRLWNSRPVLSRPKRDALSPLRRLSLRSCCHQEGLFCSRYGDQRGLESCSSLTEGRERGLHAFHFFHDGLAGRGKSRDRGYHRYPVIVVALAESPRSVCRAVNHDTVASFLDVRAEPLQFLDGGLYPVALFYSQLFAPFMTVFPFAWVAATAMIGISSMILGMMLPLKFNGVQVANT